jgi:hypothetical protein
LPVTIIPAHGGVVTAPGRSSRGPRLPCRRSLAVGTGTRTLVTAARSLGIVNVPAVTGSVSGVRLPQLAFPQSPTPRRGPRKVVRGPRRDESVPIPVGIVTRMTVRDHRMTVTGNRMTRRLPGLIVWCSRMMGRLPGMLGRCPRTTDRGDRIVVRGPFVTCRGRGKAPRGRGTAVRDRRSKRRGARQEEAGDRRTSPRSLRFGPCRPSSRRGRATRGGDSLRRRDGR